MTYYPMGMAVSIDLDGMDEPILTFAFQLPGDEDVEIVVSEQDAKAAVGMINEGIHRAVVLREMLTMFPEQREAILATVLFRWTGEVGDGSPA